MSVSDSPYDRFHIRERRLAAPPPPHPLAEVKPPSRRSPSHRASRKAVVGINDKLREVLTSNDDGTYSYLDHWTDQHVADFVGAQLGEVVRDKSVAYSREMCFGKLRKLRAASLDEVSGRRALALVLELYRQLGLEPAC
jgi:hypothetical protein